MGDQSAIAEVFRGVDTHAHTHHTAVIDSVGPPRRQAEAEKPASEGPEQGQCPHIKAKTPLTRGCCARGGTRTGFQALQTPGSLGNMRNPAQSGRCTTRFETQGVHIVHTLFLLLRQHTGTR
jgi:hypothetical protein